MTPIDDLKVGDYVAVVNSKAPCRTDFFGNDRPHEYDGKPFRIQAISLPFLALEWGEHVLSLDVRAHEVQKVSWRYAKALTPNGSQEAVLTTPRKKKRRKRDKSLCPRCGERLIQRLTTGVLMKNIWVLVCSNDDCGFEAGPVNGV